MDDLNPNEGNPPPSQSDWQGSADEVHSPYRPVVVAILVAAIIVAGGLVGSALYLGDHIEGLRRQIADVGSLPGARPADGRERGGEEPEQVDVKGLVTDADPFIGPEDAPVTIVEFSDYQCPFCRRYYEQTFSQLTEKYKGQIRYVFKDFPLPMHPQAPKASEAAHCAGDQGKYWEMHGTLFRNQGSLGEEALKKYGQQIGLDTAKYEKCLSSAKYASLVDENMKVARKVGVNGTPTFFINGERLVGAQPMSEFEKRIDAALKAKN